MKELTILITLLYTGLRVQELCDLRVADVEIGDRKGKVTVRKGKHNRCREVT
ncbi:MAG: tyrosine-type recombinase/integrase [Bacillota bacterium]